MEADLVAALFHYLPKGPAWPDAQPWENYLMVVVALLVLWIYRRQMLSGEGAATDVLMPGDEDRPANRA